MKSGVSLCGRSFALPESHIIGFCSLRNGPSSRRQVVDPEIFFARLDGKLASRVPRPASWFRYYEYQVEQRAEWAPLVYPCQGPGCGSGDGAAAVRAATCSKHNLRSHGQHYKRHSPHAASRLGIKTRIYSIANKSKKSSGANLKFYPKGCRGWDLQTMSRGG